MCTPVFIGDARRRCACGTCEGITPRTWARDAERELWPGMCRVGACALALRVAPEGVVGEDRVDSFSCGCCCRPGAFTMEPRMAAEVVTAVVIDCSSIEPMDATSAVEMVTARLMSDDIS